MQIDNTGISVEQEGEWNSGKYGLPKRRIWRKVQLEIDDETLEIRTVEVTSSDVGAATTTRAAKPERARMKLSRPNFVKLLSCFDAGAKSR